ncbi:MAG: APC family permease [Gemmatimonadales bacterium]
MSERSLHRGLGGFDVLGITVNNVVGAGIFGLPAALAAAAGNLSIAAVVATMLVIAMMAVCLIEVASRYDVTGGPMHYAGVAFGPTAGFAVGWLMYLTRLSAFGAIAAVMLDYAGGFWPALGSGAGRAAAITVFIVTLAALNLRGAAHGALVSHVLTVAKLVPLIALAAVGIGRGGWDSLPAEGPASLGAFSQALLIAFFACMGFEQGAVIAGEVKHPNRSLPFGIVGGVVIVGVLYILLMLASFALVPDLARSTRPLADAAASLLGPIGATVMSFTAVVSAGGGLSVSMLVAPRVLYALGAHGDFPSVLTRLAPVRRTPFVAIVTNAALVWLLTITGTFVYLATFSVVARILMYVSTCLALIALRRRDGPAPIKIPLGPLWAVIATVASLATLATTTGAAVRDVLIALAAGALIRMAVRRRFQHPASSG